MYAFYSLLLFMALLIYFPFYAFRTKVIRHEDIRLKERLGFGIPAAEDGETTLWIHAVSVGEVLSLQSLVRELKARHPGWKIYFSSLTNTGLRVAKERLAGADHVFFVPLDFRKAVIRALEAARPRLLVLTESEFWPNLLREAGKRTKGVLLVNGRVSERSAKRQSEIRPLVQKILSYVRFFLVQTLQDKERLEAVGIASEKVQVAGNLKCDVDLPILSREEQEALRRDLDASGPMCLVVAGSTRKGEEEKILQAFARARKERDDLHLILAPRHIERAGEVARLARNLGFSVRKRTEAGSSRNGAWDVLILDTLGELARFYALSDAAFVGGSLVSWGGHNILEPAYYGKPVFFGPHMENFAYLADSFLSAGAARVVRNEDDMVGMFLSCGRPDILDMGLKARAHLDSLAGAKARTIAAIEDMMGE